MTHGLWRAVQEKWTAALKSGALEPIVTEQREAQDGEARFVLRVAAGLEKKRAAGPKKNPFLPPYEPDLFVGELGPRHVCLLNKFPVVEHHALVITRAYEPQTDWLTADDCEVLLACLAEGDALAFYNGGAGAGASQPHKHLQLVPLKPSLEPQIRAGRLPFRFERAELPSDAGALHARLRSMLEVANVAPLEPWNLLATRDWVLIVPRAKESFEGISVNALGFAGSLFVKTREQLERVLAAGPMNVLRAVAK